MEESFSTLGFYMMSGMYHILSGTEVDICKVTFTNDTNGEVVREANSSDME